MEAAFRELVRTIWRIYLGRLDDYVFLFQRVEFTEDDHWIFTGNRAGSRRQYGVARLDGKKEMAHRAAYRLLIGPIPEGYDLDHDCELKLCVNPAHVTPRSRKEHNARHDQLAPARKRQREWTHCRHGHEFTPENTYIDERGSRHCRKCQVRRVLESRDRNRDGFDTYQRTYRAENRAEIARYARDYYHRRKGTGQGETSDQASLPLDES